MGDVEKRMNDETGLAVSGSKAAGRGPDCVALLARGPALASGAVVASAALALLAGCASSAPLRFYTLSELPPVKSGVPVSIS